MSPAQVKSDFVNVRLSAAGRIFAGANGTVRIANAHMNYKFSGDTSQRVLSSEWTKILSIEKNDGSPMFELVPAAPIATTMLPASAASSPLAQAAPASAKPAASPAPTVGIATPATDAAIAQSADASKAATSTSQPAAQPVAVATQEK